MAVHFGIDPVHFGIVVVVKFALEMFTSQLGINLFVAAQVLEIPVRRMFTSLDWPILVMIGSLMLITYAPIVTNGTRATI